MSLAPVDWEFGVESLDLLQILIDRYRSDLPNRSIRVYSDRLDICEYDALILHMPAIESGNR